MKKERKGEGKEREMKKGEEIEDKKEDEVRAMKTEKKKLTWSSKTMRQKKERVFGYQRQKRIQRANAFFFPCNSLK